MVTAATVTAARVRLVKAAAPRIQAMPATVRA